jgi:hypothetical protein
MKLPLAELQALVLKGIKDRDDQVLELVRTPPNDSREVMFGVYRNAYLLRLTEFLSNDHPQLKAYLGDDAFASLSRAYAAAHPSDTPNARWYSRHLPEFLARHEPWSAHRDVIDLALIERGLTDSFDSEDAPIIRVEDLQSIDPDAFEAARLVFHPSLRPIQVSTNAVDIWSSLRKEKAPPAPAALEDSATVITWRQGGGAKMRQLAAEEAMAMSSASEGVPFGVICEMVAVMGDLETAAMRAATYLRHWIEAELVSSVAVP